MLNSIFQFVSDFKPAGDQSAAIDQIVSNFQAGVPYQTLMGVTGSGKTFTMANVIQKVNKPTLILAHNKTLVTQLFQEFKSFFPHNAVEHFISYYDYYQPEAYLPKTDTFIEKDSSINDEIEKLRLRCTASLMSRKDVIVVASVSCIYGLGSPLEYQKMMLKLELGQEIAHRNLFQSLVSIYYSRNDMEMSRGCFRVRGDVVEIRPAYDDFIIRIDFFGDEIEKISRCDALTGHETTSLKEVLIYPARHFVTENNDAQRITKEIETELQLQKQWFIKRDKLVEAQRLTSRVKYDLEMIRETGYCNGIENYSRIISQLPVGHPPFTLLDFMGDDFNLMVDESHASLPQIRAMYGGDRSRKETLVNHGFRLPCALDNRPLNFSEFEKKIPKNILFVSATPGDYELQKGNIVQQVVRPTGLLDPIIEVRPIENQMDDLLNEIQQRVKKKQRILVITLTKKSAENLSDFFDSLEIKSLYIHSETGSLERTEILKSLRSGEIDVLVGINLLREGLDLPEVSLVAILDADKEGFLRNHRTLIQISGRAARHQEGFVIMYADRVTDSMQKTIEETKRRRHLQEVFNQKHGIVPTTIQKEIRDEVIIKNNLNQNQNSQSNSGKDEMDNPIKIITELEQQMLTFADNLEFEKASEIRDRIKQIKEKL